MILKISELTEDGRRVDFKERAAGLNAVLAESPGWAEQRFEDDVAVCAEVYKRGTDIDLAGSVQGAVRCTCPRCLEDFAWSFQRDFRFLIVKADGATVPEDDEGLDHYTGEEIDLGPLAREQALLALDPNASCSSECRGLCPGCGANLNVEACRCAGG